MLRAGLDARVSTLDQQTLPMQMRALGEHAAARGWTVAEECKEVGSGAAARAMRQRLIDGARRRDIDVVLGCGSGMWFWFGGWIGGAGRSPTWYRRCRS
jgi:hypothetical protein